jgi:hypothetical protein
MLTALVVCSAPCAAGLLGSGTMYCIVECETASGMKMPKS